MINRILHNAINSYLTSLAGTVAGLPDMIEGFTSKDWSLFAKGLGLLIIGLASNEKTLK